MSCHPLGPLSVPTIPDIPGLQAYKGRVMHTAAWDSSIDLSGKKVAVVGTGASAIQVIPHLQQVAAGLVVFQVRSLGVDTGSATRGCKGVSSKQWELGSSGVVWGVCVCPGRSGVCWVPYQHIGASVNEFMRP
jgi:hypothetical protein